ncbi:MAG: hypothetical protein MK116_06440 [Phycisphaerales bacterium]|nr:hypothetical protein [Phycisphaerales bacterium]
MRVHALQYDIAWEDKPVSQARMDALIAATPPEPGSLLVTPELGDVGFSLNIDALVDDQSLAWASGVARRYECWVQHNWVERDAGEDRGRNTAAIVRPDGSVVARYQKIFLFSPGHEQRSYEPGRAIHLVDIGGIIVCPLVCYDLRFPELWRLATIAGAELFTVCASWPAKRASHWRDLAIARAIENQAWVIAVNRTGRDPHLDYVGGSLIVTPHGEVVARGGEADEMLTAEVDPESTRAWRAEFRCLDDIRPEFLGSIDVIRH